MSTIIRPEISRKNKYWIDRHRHYELKHFCLQYPEWKRAYYLSPGISSSFGNEPPGSDSHGDPTAKLAMRKVVYMERIELIERIAGEADKDLRDYILKGVTEGLSYTYLRTKMNMPCSRDMYYDRYRKFFWLLDNARD
jgi:hypothetical protein